MLELSGNSTCRSDQYKPGLKLAKKMLNNILRKYGLSSFNISKVFILFSLHFVVRQS